MGILPQHYERSDFGYSILYIITVILQMPTRNCLLPVIKYARIAIYSIARYSQKANPGSCSCKSASNGCCYPIWKMDIVHMRLKQAEEIAKVIRYEQTGKTLH
jgi:hypothetical protein